MDRLLELLREALDLARSEKDGAGRSEYGRHLAIAVTELEAVEDRVIRANKLLGANAPDPDGLAFTKADPGLAFPKER